MDISQTMEIIDQVYQDMFVETVLRSASTACASFTLN